jgi:hypothetical protein
MFGTIYTYQRPKLLMKSVTGLVLDTVMNSYNNGLQMHRATMHPHQSSGT